MSIVLPVLYHWSPSARRAGIKRRGLTPTCGTVAGMGPRNFDGVRTVDRESTFVAVCLGTSPSHAWSLSGALMGAPGELWDLWQVVLDRGDEVHPLAFIGYRLDEVRVANRIPRDRCWLVGTRTCNSRRPY